MRFYSLLLLTTLLFTVSCKGPAPSEGLLFRNKVDAFLLLERYHHELHIMIGEAHDDMFGDDHDSIEPNEAFSIFSKAILGTNNPELAPVKNALSRIDSFSVASDEVMLLDLLVDSYQVGLQLQIKGMLGAYGAEYPPSSDQLQGLYDEVSKGGV